MDQSNLLGTLTNKAYQIQMYTLVLPWLWNFIGRRVKFNAFLHPNEHTEKICSYLVRQFEAELAKIGHFQIS